MHVVSVWSEQESSRSDERQTTAPSQASPRNDEKDLR